MTTALNRFPDAAYTVDSDNEGQDHRNANGLRIRRNRTPFGKNAVKSSFSHRLAGRVVAVALFAP
jgi:hypothetical protein